MVPKDKGWGMSNLSLWGKNPCFATFVVCHLFSHPTLSTSLMLQLVVGGVIAEVVVVVVGCQPYPLAHSTHVGHSSPSRTLPWSVHSLTTILGLLVPHAQVLDEFGLTQAFCSSPRVAKHPLNANSRPLYCCASHVEGFFPRFPLTLRNFWVFPHCWLRLFP